MIWTSRLYVILMPIDILGSGLSVKMFRTAWQSIIGGVVLQLTGFAFGMNRVANYSISIS
jgi:hypothetical protein